MRAFLLFSLLASIVSCTHGAAAVPDPNKPVPCNNPAGPKDVAGFAGKISEIVTNGLKLGSYLFEDASQKEEYTNVGDKVVGALDNGWAAPGVCNGMANPIADPLNRIPWVGLAIAAGVRPLVKAACEQRKKELGC